MADTTVTEFKQTCDKPLEVKIHDRVEIRCGTKEQLQSVGVGIGKAFPGEPGARPRIVTVRDSRGWIVKIERVTSRSEGKKIFSGRYMAITHIPDEIIWERDAPKRRKAEIYAGVEKAKLNGIDGIDAAIAAMTIEGLELKEEKEFSTQNFRKNLVDMLITGSNLHIKKASTPSAESPFYFDDETTSRIKKHLAAIEEIIFTAPMKRDLEGQRLARLEMYEMLALEPPDKLKKPLTRSLYAVK